MKVGEQGLNHLELITRLNHQIHRSGMGLEDAAMQLCHRLQAAHTGGAHRDHAATTSSVEEAILRHLDEVAPMGVEERIELRHAKYRAIGRFTEELPVG